MNFDETISVKKSKIINFNEFNSYDWLTLGYLFTWTVLILIFYNKIASANVFLIFHILGLILVFLLIGISPSYKLPLFLRHWYPAFFLPFFFTVLHYFVPAIHPGNIDQQLIQLDLLITGTYPTVWVQQFYHPLLTEIMQICYTTFYFLPLLILVPLYKHNKMSQFNCSAFLIFSAFYLSYIGYVIFPALGPRFFLAHLHDVPLKGYGLYEIISSTLNGLENIQWDAFPSGHVTVAMIFSYLAYRYYRTLFYWTLPVIVLLIISTVYLQYHYVVDVISGILLFFLVLFIHKMVN